MFKKTICILAVLLSIHLQASPLRDQFKEINSIVSTFSSIKINFFLKGDVLNEMSPKQLSNFKANLKQTLEELKDRVIEDGDKRFIFEYNNLIQITATTTALTNSNFLFSHHSLLTASEALELLIDFTSSNKHELRALNGTLVRIVRIVELSRVYWKFQGSLIELLETQLTTVDEARNVLALYEDGSTDIEEYREVVEEDGVLIPVVIVQATSKKTTEE